MNLQSSTLRYVHLACPQDLSEYLQRSSQPLPSTPRISINTKNQQILSVYVQTLAHSFLHTEWESFKSGAIFQYLETAIIANMGLKKKFGCFRINQNLIKLGPNNSLRVWINQDPVLNYRQHPLAFERASETIMVEGILKLFKPLIPQLEALSKPETLQGFLSEVRLQKKPQLSFMKALKVETNYTHSRRAIKSFYELPKQKPMSSIFSPINTSLDGAATSKSFLSTLSQFYSPKNLSVSQKKDNNFSNPKSSFSKKPTISLGLQLNKRLVSFTYSSPMSMKSSMIQHGLVNAHFIDPSLERTAQPKTSRPLQSVSIIAQGNNEDKEEKEKVFCSPKFPHSTESTLVTLKETKSFSDIQFQHQGVAIEEEKSQVNVRASSKGSKGSYEERSRKASCNEFSSVESKKSAQENKPSPQLGAVDIEDDFLDLFGEKEEENSFMQEEFTQREQEFEDILFS